MFMCVYSSIRLARNLGEPHTRRPMGRKYSRLHTSAAKHSEMRVCLRAPTFRKYKIHGVPTSISVVEKYRPLDAGRTDMSWQLNLPLPRYGLHVRHLDRDRKRNMDKQAIAGKPPLWKCVLVVSEACVTSDRSWSTPPESPVLLRTLQAFRFPIILARSKHGKIPPSPKEGARGSRKCVSLVHWHQSS